jgi:glucose-1-phosphate cytidylyltransferase
MKVVILAGGYGTRLGEETDLKPKPMVQIGHKPILWHIMKSYSSHGFNEFIILLGYKGYVIKEYFVNYFIHQNDLTIDLEKNKIDYFNNESEPWKVTLINTGMDTMTGGRVLRAKEYVGNNRFMLTYGDGLTDIDLKKLLDFHIRNKNCVTMTAVQPEGRFGSLDISDNKRIINFTEKPRGDNTWINGGFFVCEPEVFNYIEGDRTIFEREPLENLARDRKLHAYKHSGFWKCLDTPRDKIALEDLWETNRARWKTW